LAAFLWNGKSVGHNAPHLAISSLEAAQHTVREVITTNVVLVVVTAGVGLITANILRKRSNLEKLVGISFSAITILITEILIFPEMFTESVTLFGAVGLGLISVGSWRYHHSLSSMIETRPNSPTLEDQKLLADAEPGNFAMDLLSDDRVNPDTGHIVTEDEVKWPSSSASWTTPTLPKLYIAFMVWIMVGGASCLLRKYGSDYTFHVDVNRFFSPLGLDPSPWGLETALRNVDCVKGWVREKGVYARSHQLAAFESEFLNSDCPLYPVPDGGFKFHAFYAGPNRPFHTIVIDAFLATQRLGDGHRMIYWLESEETWEEVTETYRAYSAFVEFRVFVPAVEAAGTCMETKPEFISEEYRRGKDMPVTSWSDLVRVVLLHKYGGIWLDADTILLRDLTPLSARLRQTFLC
jgi:hypothetical protein